MSGTALVQAFNFSAAEAAEKVVFSGFGYPTSASGIDKPRISINVGGTTTSNSQIICNAGHYGQDYSMNFGDPVYAAADGVVFEKTEWPVAPFGLDGSHGWGGVIVIKHDISQTEHKFITDGAIHNGSKSTTNLQTVYTLYAHLAYNLIGPNMPMASNINIQKGQLIHKGDIIGYVAQVYYSRNYFYPSHLHFEIKDEFGIKADKLIGDNSTIACPEDLNSKPNEPINERCRKGVGSSCSPKPGKTDYHYIGDKFIQNNSSPITETILDGTAAPKKSDLLNFIAQIRARINDLLAQLSKIKNPTVQNNPPINSQPAVSAAGTKSAAVAQGSTVNFVSYPIGAKVSVDGVMRGVTPLFVGNISAGWHNIIFSKTGYQECLKTALISGGQIVNCNLNQLPVSVTNTQASTEYEASGTTAQIQPKTVVPFSTLTADLGGVAYGTGTTLRWSSSNATGCTASGGWSGTKALSGSQDTGPLYSTQTFILTCAGPGGSAVQQTLVSVVSNNPATVVAASALAPTLKFTAPLTWVMYGQGTTLNWSSSNAVSCTASGGWSGDKPLNGAKDTGPLHSTNTFVLTCTGPGGSVNRSVSIGIKNAPTLAVTDVYAATQGDNFNLSGSNFSPNGRVTLHFARASGNFYPDRQVQADPYGKIAYSWPVPSDATPGNSSVSATDDTNGLQTSSIGFRIVAAANTTGNLNLSVSPASGSLSTVFTVSGTNFTPNSAVMIHFENADIGQFLIRQPASDANGNLSYSWNPAADTPSGAVSIWAVDNGTGRNSPKVSLQITP